MKLALKFNFDKVVCIFYNLLSTKQFWKYNKAFLALVKSKKNAPNSHLTLVIYLQMVSLYKHFFTCFNGWANCILTADEKGHFVGKKSFHVENNMDLFQSAWDFSQNHSKQEVLYWNFFFSRFSIMFQFLNFWLPEMKYLTKDEIPSSKLHMNPRSK